MEAKIMLYSGISSNLWRFKETIKKDLPAGFQRSEFLLEHGFLDFIVDRKELKNKLSEVAFLFRN